eukprot:481384_1
MSTEFNSTEIEYKQIEYQHVQEDEPNDENEYKKKEAKKDPKLQALEEIKKVEFIHQKTQLFLMPMFLIVIIVTLIISILHFALKSQGIIGICIIIVLTWFGVFSGLYGIYFWEKIQKCIDIVKPWNKQYKVEISELKSAKGNLLADIRPIQDEIDKQKTMATELEKQMEQFEELKSELMEIAADNESLNDLLNDCNEMYQNLNRVIFENAKANLVVAYYSASLRDDEEGMSKMEYKRFLARLDKRTRSAFKALGGFEAIAGADNIIDLQEFMQSADKVVEQMNDEMVLNQLYQ